MYWNREIYSNQLFFIEPRLDGKLNTHYCSSTSYLSTKFHNTIRQSCIKELKFVIKINPNFLVLPTIVVGYVIIHLSPDIWLFSFKSLTKKDMHNDIMAGELLIMSSLSSHLNLNVVSISVGLLMRSNPH